MITLQKIGKLLALFLCVGIIASCEDEESVAPLEFIGDVYVTKRLVDGEEQFANSYYAYGNQAMSFAQVTTPNGTEIELSKMDDNAFSYGYTAQSDDFSTESPESGNYTFDVIHDGIQHQSIDLLDYAGIEFTPIYSAVVETEMLVVEWEENPDAEVYMVRLVNEAGDVVFGSPTLTVNARRYEIDTFSGSGVWESGYPNIGDTYTLELHSFAFDQDATSTDYSFKIQEVSVSEEIVNWN